MATAAVRMPPFLPLLVIRLSIRLSGATEAPEYPAPLQLVALQVSCRLAASNKICGESQSIMEMPHLQDITRVLCGCDVSGGRTRRSRSDLEDSCGQPGAWKVCKPTLWSNKQRA